MRVTLADQLVIARRAIEEQRRIREEEYQKDLEALERVARFLPASSAPSRVNGAHAPVIVPPVVDEPQKEETQFDESQGYYLIRAVLALVQSRPNVSLSPRMVLEILEAQNFPFTRNNGKRILSVAQALRKLTERDQPQVRLVRRGSGRRPNLYRALVQEINPAHVTTASLSSERTM
jgi:hypothetical protein